MNTGERLRMLREQFKMTQEEVADKLGVNRVTYLKWETGENQPIRKLKEISELYGVSYDYILGNDAHAEKQPRAGVRIPVLGTIAAGVPLDAIEDIIDWEEIPEDWLRGGSEYFALKIKGGSMEPRIFDGDVVIVRKQPCVESGQVAAVMVGNEAATVKKIKITPEGVMLIGLNASVYEPHFYTTPEIESLPLKVLGRVVEVRGKVS